MVDAEITRVSAGYDADNGFNRLQLRNPSTDD